MRTSENLPPFSNTQCPKCGGGVKTTWHECGQGDPSFPCFKGGVHRGEHLCRQCSRCGYGWLEATNDAAGEPRRHRPAT
jgi:ribosomal protein S27AE